MSELPEWFRELAPGVQVAVRNYLRAPKARIAELEDVVETQRRIIGSRDAEIAGLKEALAAAQARGNRKRRHPRVEELCDELLAWYRLSRLMTAGLREIGERFGDYDEQARDACEPSGEDSRPG